MSLTFPLAVGSRASTEAEENLKQLLHVDIRGRKDQVATRVALGCLQRMQELCPSYFAGVKSWVKAGSVYAIGGTAAASVIGLTGYILYRAALVAINNGYQLEVAILGLTSVGGSVVASELGFKPLGGLVAFLALTVRDAANRAAKWSVKNDIKSLQQKENEVKECHQMIVNQLSTVYNDSAKKMREIFIEADKNNHSAKLLELQQMASTLKERLPSIKKFLNNLSLGNHEIENVLQGLIDVVRFVEAQGCQLKPHCDARNTALITGSPKSMIEQMAVPINIKERIGAANLSRFSFVERLGGYSGSVWAGGKTFVGFTAALAVLTGAVSCCRLGVVDTCKVIVNIFSDEKWNVLSDPWLKVILGTGSFGAVGAASTVMVKKSWHHHCDILSNSEYVNSEIDLCKGDLKEIYDGVKRNFEGLDQTNKRKIGAALLEKMSDIKQAIRDQGINPDEITKNLESLLLEPRNGEWAE